MVFQHPPEGSSSAASYSDIRNANGHTEPSFEEALSYVKVSCQRSSIDCSCDTPHACAVCLRGAQTAATPASESMPSPQLQTPAKLAESESLYQPVDKGGYILGAGDQVTVRVFGADDLPERPTEVGTDGKISLPMVGKVQASGVSVRDVETDLTARYKTYFKDPQITVTVDRL